MKRLELKDIEPYWNFFSDDVISIIALLTFKRFLEGRLSGDFLLNEKR